MGKKRSDAETTDDARGNDDARNELMTLQMQNQEAADKVATLIRCYLC